MPHPINRLFIPAPGQKLRPRRIKPEEVVVKADTPPELLSAIERLAKKWEPQLAAAVLKMLSEMQGAVDLDQLAAALATGDMGKVLALIDGANTAAAESAIHETIQDGAWAGGALAAAEINASLTGTTFVFNRLNPRLITWLQTYSLGLIRQVNEQTKEAIRDKLIAGMTQGASPIKTAREIKGAIGLTTKQAKAVGSFRKELETFHLKRSAKGWNLGAQIDRVNGRQVFKPGEDGTPKDGIDTRRLRDFRHDAKLKQAMQSGKPLSPQQIDKMVAAYERKYLRHRSEVIARTESLRTTNFGVQDAWRQAIEAGKIVETQVRRRWLVAHDERLCEVCSAIPGLNPKLGVKFGQPFATPKGPTMLPPIHPNCRCTVIVRQYEPEQLAHG